MCSGGFEHKEMKPLFTYGKWPRTPLGICNTATLWPCVLPPRCVCGQTAKASSHIVLLHIEWHGTPVHSLGKSVGHQSCDFKGLFIIDKLQRGVNKICRDLWKPLIFFFLDFSLGLDHVSIRLDLEALFQFSHLVLTFKVQVDRVCCPLYRLPKCSLPGFLTEDKNQNKSRLKFCHLDFVLELILKRTLLVS
jgi:hypothetical protein